MDGMPYPAVRITGMAIAGIALAGQIEPILNALRQAARGE
jgi:hypothetical protein